MFYLFSFYFSKTITEGFEPSTFGTELQRATATPRNLLKFIVLYYLV